MCRSKSVINVQVCELRITALLVCVIGIYKHEFTNKKNLLKNKNYKVEKVSKPFCGLSINFLGRCRKGGSQNVLFVKYIHFFLLDKLLMHSMYL